MWWSTEYNLSRLTVPHFPSNYIWEIVNLFWERELFFFSMLHVYSSPKPLEVLLPFLCISVYWLSMAAKEISCSYRSDEQFSCPASLWETSLGPRQVQNIKWLLQWNNANSITGYFALLLLVRITVMLFVSWRVLSQSKSTNLKLADLNFGFFACFLCKISFFGVMLLVCFPSSQTSPKRNLLISKYFSPKHFLYQNIHSSTDFIMLVWSWISDCQTILVWIKICYNKSSLFGSNLLVTWKFIWLREIQWIQ